MNKNILSNKYQYDDLLIRSKDPYANAKYDILLSWLKKNKIKSILNVGCGSGEFCFILASRGYDVVGIDPDKDYIQLATKQLKKHENLKCQFYVKSIEEFVTNRKFDAVIATDVLEHIENDSRAFEKMITFIKKGGNVLCTVPAGQYLFGFHDVKLGHFRRYSLKTFKKIIPSSVKINQLRYFGIFLIPVVLLISKIVKKSYPVAESNDSKVLNIILNIEKKIVPVLGTSVLFWGEKN